MFVTAPPVCSPVRVMWYSAGPGYASNCHPKREPQNSRPSAVSSAGISKCTIWPGIFLLSLCAVRRCRSAGGHSSRPRARPEFIGRPGLGGGRARRIRLAQHELGEAELVRGPLDRIGELGPDLGVDRRSVVEQFE